MPSWRKLLTTGADADLGNLNVINAVTASFFTGSLFTGSFAGDGSLLTDVDISVIEVATVYDTFTSVTTKNLCSGLGLSFPKTWKGVSVSKISLTLY